MKDFYLALLSLALLTCGCYRQPAIYLVNATDHPLALVSYLPSGFPPEAVIHEYDEWQEGGINFSDSIHPPQIFLYFGQSATSRTGPLALSSFCQQYSLENPPLDIASDSTSRQYGCACLDTLEDERTKATFFIRSGETIEMASNPSHVAEIHLSWADSEAGEINRMDLVGPEALATVLQPTGETDDWKLELR